MRSAWQWPAPRMKPAAWARPTWAMATTRGIPGTSTTTRSSRTSRPTGPRQLDRASSRQGRDSARRRAARRARATVRRGLAGPEWVAPWALVLAPLVTLEPRVRAQPQRVARLAQDDRVVVAVAAV